MGLVTTAKPLKLVEKVTKSLQNERNSKFHNILELHRRKNVYHKIMTVATLIDPNKCIWKSPAHEPRGLTETCLLSTSEV